MRPALIDGRDLVWVAKSQGSPFGLRYDPDRGQIGRLSCSATGHAWLAGLTDEEALALVARQGYGSREEFGPKAPQTPAALLKYLRQARKRGFAMVVQTSSPWMNAASAPIRHPQTREVIGAVVIAGPHIRLTEEKMEGLSPLLLTCARELSLALGASPGLSRQSLGPFLG